MEQTQNEIITSPMGIQMRAMALLLQQLEDCRAALANKCEMVMLDGEEYDAVNELRLIASGIMKVAEGDRGQAISMTWGDRRNFLSSQAGAARRSRFGHGRHASKSKKPAYSPPPDPRRER